MHVFERCVSENNDVTTFSGGVFSFRLDSLHIVEKNVVFNIDL